jgi:putative FmdB family regulatory protein
MPVYEYRCKNCGRTHEIEHGFHDKRPTQCPSCGGELQRVFHPVGVVFKGSGFHKTDYSRSGTGSPASTASGDAKSGDTKSSDVKPAESPKAADTKKAGDKKGSEKSA